MTVTVEISRVFHTGTGLLTTFAFPFRVFDEDDLVVTTVDLSNNEVTLTEGPSYTVHGVGEATGTVTLLGGPLALNWKLIIERVMPIVQETRLRATGKFIPSAHEDEYDRLAMRIQQLENLLQTRNPALARVPVLHVGDTGPGSFRGLGHRISDLADPIDDQDAATKSWVQTTASSGIVQISADYTYTEVTLPAANSMPGYMVRVKDTGQPEKWLGSIRNVAGIYAWEEIKVGGLG